MQQQLFLNETYSKIQLLTESIKEPYTKCTVESYKK
jgi:hypothetical protein